ncbi:Phosphoinositide phosphatase [Vigna angularis]|uniref:Phosphoinositide phosphatase n=1 Tax=Phaseolus angularis TaxID=3914 RepID=A0A8T0JU97_PHAAN|nr:Phosphoinositide phosphatase [Vigna angularis]
MAKSRSTLVTASAKVHPSNDPELDSDSYALEKFYLIGSDWSKRFFRVLKIDRSEPSDLNMSQDPVLYSPQEIKSLLQRIAEGNRATSGLTFVAKVFGIAGKEQEYWEQDNIREEYDPVAYRFDKISVLSVVIT